MPSSITQSQLLPILAAVVAFLFAALLLLYIYRLLFGRRIKAPGPRNRPRRLDIVDTFELDGDRQLVIVRRDNVEHLLLLGGPNDLLVEASITRVESREARPREAGAPSGWPLAPPPIGPILSPLGETDGKGRPVEPGLPPSSPPPPPPGLSPLPSDMFAPPPPPPPKPAIPPLAAQPSEPAPPPQSAAPRPAPPRFTPPPPRPGFTPTPRPPRPAPPPFLSRAQRPAPPQTGAEPGPVMPPPPAPASPPGPAPEAPAAPPPSAAPPPPATPEPAPAAVAPPPAAPAPAPVPPAAPTPPAQEPPHAAPKPAEAADPLDLEAEMARLLGRPEPKQ